MPGDGIGVDVAHAGVRVLKRIAEEFGHDFDLPEALIGGAAIDATGDPLPPTTVTQCLQSNAVLLGAVGGPKWSDPNSTVRPEQGLLKIRKELGLFANLRPVRLHPKLVDASPLKPEILEGVDMMVVRVKKFSCQMLTKCCSRFPKIN